MLNTGYLSFKDDEVKKTFLSLNEKELKEFEIDLAQLLKKTNDEMVKANFFEGHHFANQRIGERLFKVELWVNLTPSKNPVVILSQFKELNVDDYLDSINSDKSLKDDGFVRLLP